MESDLPTSRATLSDNIEPSSSSSITINPPAEYGAEDVDPKEQRKKELREAGKDYFNRAVSQVSKGIDPFQATPITQKQAKTKLTKPEDPDLVAFGTALEGSKLYILVAIFVVCQSASWILIKVLTATPYLMSSAIIQNKMIVYTLIMYTSLKQCLLFFSEVHAVHGNTRYSLLPPHACCLGTVLGRQDAS
jgi:hypothetical protein